MLIDAEEIDRGLSGLLSSRVWNEYLVPILLKRRNDQIVALCDPRQSRKDQMPDDHLRGAISTLDWVLKFPHRELAKARATHEDLAYEGDDL